jgi:hypothetical protein
VSARGVRRVPREGEVLRLVAAGLSNPESEVLPGTSGGLAP